MTTICKFPTTVVMCKQVDKARIHYAELEYSSACDIILSIASAGNLYMNNKAPWSLFKQGGSAAEDAAQVSLMVSFMVIDGGCVQSKLKS